MQDAQDCAYAFLEQEIADAMPEKSKRDNAKPNMRVVFAMGKYPHR